MWAGGKGPASTIDRIVARYYKVHAITMPDFMFLIKRIAQERGNYITVSKKPENPEAWAEALGLNRIADKVLAHKPKPKSKPAKKRARRRNKIQRKLSI